MAYSRSSCSCTKRAYERPGCRSDRQLTKHISCRRRRAEGIHRTEVLQEWLGRKRQHMEKADRQAANVRPVLTRTGHRIGAALIVFPDARKACRVLRRATDVARPLGVAAHGPRRRDG